MAAYDKFRLAAHIVLMGFIIAISFHTIASFYGFSYPFNTFLFLPSSRFSDFLNVYHLNFQLDPYSSLSPLADYFPFCYLIFFPFTFLPPLESFIVLCTLFLGFIYWMMSSYLHQAASTVQDKKYLSLLITLFFLSFPVLFCLDRGNLDMLVFIIVALLVTAFLNKKYFSSAVLLAIATSMKIYPAVFIMLFIKEKRWKECIAFVLLTIALTFFALALFKTQGVSNNFHLFMEIYARMNETFVIGDRVLDYSSSLFQFLKIIIWYLPPYYHHLELYQQFIKHLQPYYFLFCMVAFLFISAYILFIEKIMWKKVMLLTLAVILFPYVSADYKLIFLFIPFLLFVTTAKEEKYDRLYTVLFAFLFIPKNYFLIPGAMFEKIPHLAVYSIMDFINVIIMIIFISMIVVTGLRKTPPPLKKGD